MKKVTSKRLILDRAILNKGIYNKIISKKPAVKKQSLGRKVFQICNVVILVLCALICLLPLLNILAISFSSSAAAGSGMVSFLPVDFNLKSYEFVLQKAEFWQSFWVSVKRVVVAVPLSLLLTILMAYPLSKADSIFKGRKVYTGILLFTMLFSGGLIPWYMAIADLNLIDSFWALILPNAVSAYNTIILMNFFRQLPVELEEAASIDGASHWRILFQIVVPLSKPAIATIVLFCIVTNWNSWFDGLLLMNSPSKYPLQSYLQTVIVNSDMSLMSATDILALGEISDRTQKAAQAFVAALPILCVYPFLQKYFTEGLVVGSVKG